MCLGGGAIRSHGSWIMCLGAIRSWYSLMDYMLGGLFAHGSYVGGAMCSWIVFGGDMSSWIMCW